jgi:Na+/H+-dicarboxylate symporter
MTRLRLWIAVLLGIPLGIIAGYGFGNAWGSSDYLGCDIFCFVTSLQGPAIGVLITPIILFFGLTLFWRPAATCDPNDPMDDKPLSSS